MVSFFFSRTRLPRIREERLPDEMRLIDYLVCIDAVPKKRGPKTDVLEALLKRVDGLEAKLKEKKDQPGTNSSAKTSSTPAPSASKVGSKPAVIPEEPPSSSVESSAGDTIEVKSQPIQPVIDTSLATEMMESAVYTPSPSRCANLPPIFSLTPGRGMKQLKTKQLTKALFSAPSPPGFQTDALLDTYFSRFHAKPFFVLDESSVRQRLQLNQLPTFLIHAVYAVAAR